ncbi:MAG: MoaD/ThiS family protein [Planctomycetota bacterium]
MKIIIPTALRKHTGGASHVDVTAVSVASALQELVSIHPELRSSLLDDSGVLVSFVNVFVNDQNIRDLDDQSIALKESDEILLVPAIAGG